MTKKAINQKGKLDKQLLSCIEPNFVFENDPLFSTITLYDVDGNVINVNSWVECAHYVNGGWSSVLETGYIGSFVLLQVTAVLYLGYGLLRFMNKDRTNE